jgi:acetoin utilization protein AcuB
MIVRDIMTTNLVTIAPDDTLAHAVALLRQHQFHHLPVVRTANVTIGHEESEEKKVLLEGVLTSQDIDMVAALARQESSSRTLQRPWQERRVVEVMHRALMRVTPATSVAAAAQMLVERNLTYLPVVEYVEAANESKAVLVGLVTRSDLLVALSRTMGAFEPGMQVEITLPMADISPLAHALLLASELHVAVRSIVAVPSQDGLPVTATIRLGTINPTPFLMRLQAEGIQYSFGDPLDSGEPHV